MFSSLDYRHETGFWGIGMNNELFLAYSMNRKYLTKKKKRCVGKCKIIIWQDKYFPSLNSHIRDPHLHLVHY